MSESYLLRWAAVLFLVLMHVLMGDSALAPGFATVVAVVAVQAAYVLNNLTTVRSKMKMGATCTLSSEEAGTAISSSPMAKWAMVALISAAAAVYLRQRRPFVELPFASLVYLVALRNIVT